MNRIHTQRIFPASVNCEFLLAYFYCPLLPKIHIHSGNMKRNWERLLHFRLFLMNISMIILLNCFSNISRINFRLCSKDMSWSMTLFKTVFSFCSLSSKTFVYKTWRPGFHFYVPTPVKVLNTSLTSVK